MKRVLLIRYGEIHLKGLNRPYFERAVLHAIEEVTRGVEGIHTYRGQGRFYLEGYPETMEPQVIQAVCKVFGVHSVSPALCLEKDLDAIAEAAAEMMRERGYVQGTFKADSRRSDKQFPLNSMQLNEELGYRLLEAIPGLSVDIHTPQWTVYCEIREEAYLYVDKIPGAGGMPSGTGGKVLLLLSGGIDSPVAGWMLGKRGSAVDAIYFDSPPHTSARARQKVVDLAQIVADWTGRVRLHIVPFTQVQEMLYDKGPEDMLTLLMRRAMMRIAERVARRTGCQALATGESLGQVASQTMEAIACTEDGVGMPVLRPLICFDKNDTIEVARKIGTFETSILPYEDCCTVFVPKHPLTKPQLPVVRAAEEAVYAEGGEALLEEAMKGIQVMELTRRPAFG